MIPLNYLRTAPLSLWIGMVTTEAPAYVLAHSYRTAGRIRTFIFGFGDRRSATELHPLVHHGPLIYRHPF